MRVNACCAVLAGLALRLFFVLRFPSTDSGDAPFYIELAWNWLKKGVYGLNVNGQLTPVDLRAPGYPGFLAAVFAFAGNSQRAVMFVQVVVDLATCFVISLIAARLAPAASRRRVALAGLWLAALCPFTANYTAVVLTETLVTFLTALAILVLMEAYRGEIEGSARRASLSPWFLGGIVVGFGALVRPETPLLLAAVAIVLLARWFRPRDWKHLARAGAWMAAGLLLPLLPWAARNWRTLHEVQFLAPRYGELPGEYPPLGFTAWTETWLWHYRDVYLTLWKTEVDTIPIIDIPASAFDSQDERARVANLLAQYNATTTLSRSLDDQFGEIARERTVRHPLRTYLKIPLLRTLTLWFTPRIELLPCSGDLWPAGEAWRYDRHDFLATLSLAVINAIYVALAVAGAWISRGRCGWWLLVAFILVRTAFFAWTIDTPEPRYVLECFPAVIAFAAQAFSGTRQAAAA